ncbi:hypothetical protein Lpp126_06115 [Lacticaseibacillus paracasei subsp. paracasei Lpp126]|uniref:Uncharacterized protein n=1 Tax=Lacticaseibacillus paracasei subsp. paracasei Lpp126 TaxID=1256206 RepID=S2RQ08_LACPA|nr:hypothetical protein Lpp126_06115 [Lacticaseibacillus paracasei subsp. paracasei Lpp126]
MPYLLGFSRAGDENDWFLPFRRIMLPISDLILAAGRCLKRVGGAGAPRFSAPRFSALAEEAFLR